MEPELLTMTQHAKMAGYRVLRQLGTGERAQVHLAVADDVPDASTCALRVYPPGADQVAIGREIAAMADGRCSSIPGLVDLATLSDGTTCVATERLDGPPLARLLEPGTRTLGEAVTMLAPIIAAMAELADIGYTHSRLGVSDVRIDGSGRPRLIGLGALQPLEPVGPGRVADLRQTHRALASLVDSVAASVAQSAPLRAISEWIRVASDERPYTLTEEQIERRLFEVAAARPLRMSLPTESVELRGRVGIAAAIEPVDGPAGGEPVSTWRSYLRRRTQRDPDGEQRLGAVVAVPNTVRELLRARRRPLIFGAIAGAMCLVALLIALPSSGSPERAAAATSEPHATRPALPTAPSAPAGSTPATSPAAPTDATGSEDVVAAATELLTRRAECFAMLDAGCVTGYAQPGSAAEAQDRQRIQRLRNGEGEAAVLGSGTVTLISDMGGACLLQVERPGREPASLLVVRGEAGWLLRESFD